MYVRFKRQRFAKILFSPTSQFTKSIDLLSRQLVHTTSIRTKCLISWNFRPAPWNDSSRTHRRKVITNYLARTRNRSRRHCRAAYIGVARDRIRTKPLSFDVPMHPCSLPWGKKATLSFSSYSGSAGESIRGPRAPTSFSYHRDAENTARLQQGTPHILWNSAGRIGREPSRYFADNLTRN